MFEAPASEYLVPFDGSFRVSKASTSALTDRHPHKGKHRKRATDSLKQLQRVLAAGDRHAVLLVFQAMDAAGKDSTIRAVMQGVDPSGCQVFSFKKPSSQELDHDFLWRTSNRLPERGQSLRGGARRQGASADSRLAEDTGRIEPRDYLE
jgi:polyphosphate kinase 2 (PPK2 family)